MTEHASLRRGGFSLLELVLVVVIIGIIAALAIPRMSRGASGASGSALTGNLAVMRHAIDHYSVEHNGAFPATATFAAQLTLYSSAAGATNATKDATYAYGPYLLQVPALPVGAAKGNSGVAAAAGSGVGWIYNSATGSISANTTASETDAAGKAYNNY
ncbi:MAG: prepilin-type N-terminal cleavage/methylation domain-containing protein [Planctomycetota bacterium]|nr:prepilin-type N-terminal cleavage/methylation domain-containing protein [Planctomycetota bacterium]